MDLLAELVGEWQSVLGFVFVIEVVYYQGFAYFLCENGILICWTLYYIFVITHGVDFFLMCDVDFRHFTVSRKTYFVGEDGGGYVVFGDLVCIVGC